MPRDFLGCPIRFLARRALAALTVALWLAAPVAAHTDDPRQLSFTWPAEGAVTSPFGPRAGGFHPGIDIGTLRSLRVRAAEEGRVVRVGEPPGFEGYGTIVEVDLGAGMTTIYAHLARTEARVGDWVERRTEIGIAGCTGWCTGTHLHFELRDHGRPIDPRPYIGVPAVSSP